MAKRRSQAWKALEKEAARITRGKRISRGDDFSRKDVDVVVKDLPFLKIDGKYRVRHAHHSFLREIDEKYCKTVEDQPVLFSKTHGQRGCFVTIDGEFFGFLLDVLRAFSKE